MKFRKRLEKSKTLVRFISWNLAGYLKLCARTTDWQSHGRDELCAALEKGPVILVMWHSRLLFGPQHWPRNLAKVSTLHDRSFAGRVAAGTLARMGMEPYAMSSKKSNLKASRAVLKRFSKGVCLGLTADGPLGPALEMNAAPVEWARATGLPVFFYAYSTTRQKRLSSWDQMLVPKPFSKGAFVYARWDDQIDRRAPAETVGAKRLAMKAALDKVQAEADAMIGLPPGP